MSSLLLLNVLTFLAKYRFVSEWNLLLENKVARFRKVSLYKSGFLVLDFHFEGKNSTVHILGACIYHSWKIWGEGRGGTWSLGRNLCRHPLSVWNHCYMLVYLDCSIINIMYWTMNSCAHVYCISHVYHMCRLWLLPTFSLSWMRAWPEAIAWKLKSIVCRYVIKYYAICTTSFFFCWVLHVNKCFHA